jgi:hypothetical protein
VRKERFDCNLIDSPPNGTCSDTFFFSTQTIPVLKLYVQTKHQYKFS